MKLTVLATASIACIAFIPASMQFQQFQTGQTFEVAPRMNEAVKSDLHQHRGAWIESNLLHPVEMKVDFQKRSPGRGLSVANGVVNLSPLESKVSDYKKKAEDIPSGEPAKEVARQKRLKWSKRVKGYTNSDIAKEVIQDYKEAEKFDHVKAWEARLDDLRRGRRGRYAKRAILNQESTQLIKRSPVGSTVQNGMVHLNRLESKVKLYETKVRKIPGSEIEARGQAIGKLAKWNGAVGSFYNFYGARDMVKKYQNKDERKNHVAAWEARVDELEAAHRHGAGPS